MKSLTLQRHSIATGIGTAIQYAILDSNTVDAGKRITQIATGDWVPLDERCIESTFHDIIAHHQVTHQYAQKANQ